MQLSAYVNKINALQLLTVICRITRKKSKFYNNMHEIEYI